MNKKLISISKLIVRGRILQLGHFRLSNGIESPYYLDFTLLSKRIDLLKALINMVSDYFNTHGLDNNISKYGGILNRGAVITIPLSYERGMPFTLISKDSEVSVGIADINDSLLLIDDMLSTGKTMSKIISGLEEKYGLAVDKVFVVLDREEGGYRVLREMGIETHRLITISDVAKILYDLGVLSEEEFYIIKEHVDKFKS